MDDKEKSKLYFNRHTETGLNKNGYWRHDYLNTIRLFLNFGSRNVVDIGCGNGAFIAEFHKRYPSAAISGLDYSGEMVRCSQERNPFAKVTEGDAENMPFEDQSFDGVSCHMSIHHYPHPESALHEMHRILKPDGLVVINDLTGPRWLLNLMNWSFQTWNTGDHQVYSVEEMKDMLAAAGFKNIRSKMLTPFSYAVYGQA